MTALPGPSGVIRTIHQSSDLAAGVVTQASIPGLAFQLNAGKTYTVEGVIIASADAAARDMDCAATVTGGTVTGNWVWEITDTTTTERNELGEILSAASAVAATGDSDIPATELVGTIKFVASISVSADGTVIQLTGGQGTDAGTTTFSGGWLRVSEVN